MVFNTLWTILLGVIGGVVSSLIVSRVFLILNEYQVQLRYINGIIQKVEYISGFLQSAKAIFEVSYDQNVKIEKEMKEKGYHSEMEYFAAHADEDWISKNDVLEVFRKEINKVVNSIHDDLSNNPIEDTHLNNIIRDIVIYIRDVASMKEFTFSQINQFKEREHNILKQYDTCQHMTGQKLVRLILKDKVMIVLFFIIGFLVIGTIIAFVYKL